MIAEQEIRITAFPEGTESTIPRFPDEFSIPVKISNSKHKCTLYYLSPYRYKNKVVGLEHFGNAIALVGQKENGDFYIDVYRQLRTPSIVLTAKKMLAMK